MVRIRSILNVRPVGRTHYAEGAGERGRDLIPVACGVDKRALNDLWVSGDQRYVTCASCRKALAHA